ncbi:uncharacterized protein LOC118644332 isoform X2 [Monomorium pharaonis]|uniref:uncharacterized protein LOC118644332 isoform X2 n=1 Tax=Monomorium pharaonis TaxID=307658 RepID=UPI001747CDA1|nr:uncharacterized protein LOC118644332 isoform X2 [Monomorium pharaonis]
MSQMFLKSMFVHNPVSRYEVALIRKYTIVNVFYKDILLQKDESNDFDDANSDVDEDDYMFEESYVSDSEQFEDTDDEMGSDFENATLDQRILTLRVRGASKNSRHVLKNTSILYRRNLPLRRSLGISFSGDGK